MKLVVGNQKSYLNKEDVLEFIKITKKSKCSDVIICPTYPFITLYKDNSDYILGAQDVSEKDNGGTTGEVSARELKSLGVTYSIVGHSERRENQDETSNRIVNKMNRLEEQEMKTIFCVGENKETRDSGNAKDFVGKEIIEVFDNIKDSYLENVIIAYEPIWAIGTGVIPSNDEIKEMINYIKDLVRDRYKTDIKVLYGGSVNKNNIDELNKIDEVDGYLIGGASTKEEFNYIIERNA
jgi:triosephosphate isomerase